MLKDVSKGMVVNILVYDENSDVPINESGIISNIDDDKIVIVRDYFGFERIEILVDHIISIVKKDLPQSIYKNLVEYSKSSDNVNQKLKELQNIKCSEKKLKELLIESQFMENYSLDGAVNYLNNTVKKYGTISVNENEMNFRFIKNDDGEIEVIIKAVRKFEFYNTTSQADIDKAADTYAPEIKEELKRSLHIFKNIFLVNRCSEKISDYLYQSISEYSGEFFCTKENFFERKKEVETLMEAAIHGKI